MKRLLALLCVGVMALSACGNGSGTEAPNQNPAAQPASANDGFDEALEPLDEVAVQQQSGGLALPELEEGDFVMTDYDEMFPTLEDNNLVIVHYVSEDDYRDLVREGKTDVVWATAREFERKYGGRVRIISVPYSDMVSRTISMQSAGSAPDLLLLSDQTFPTVAASNVVQAMEDLVDDTGRQIDFRKELWNDKLMEAFSFEGKTYGINIKHYIPSVTLIYYNESMFKREGLELPKDLYIQGNWTWDEFAKAAARLTQDTTGNQQYDQMGFATWTFIPSLFALANDTAIIKADENGRHVANFNDPKMLSTLNFLYDAFQLPENGGFTSLHAGLTFETEFPAGNIAMVHSNPPPDTVRFDWDVVPMPIGPDNKNNALAAQVFGYGIPTGAKNPEGALAFLHMTGDPRYDEFNKAAAINRYSGKTGGVTDTAKGEWVWDNLIDGRGKAAELNFNMAMDRSFSDIWHHMWNICEDLSEGERAATIAATYQRVIQSALDQSLGKID
jgi:ABC-type glycerol-3-phosphate transport system substrate-binding protein